MYPIKLILYCAFASFFWVGCTGSENQGRTPNSVNKEAPISQTVEVVKPVYRSFTAEVLISGNARPNKKVLVYAMEGGYVESMPKDIGDKVTKGDVLAVLKNPELNRQLQKLTVETNSKKAVYDRLMQVYEKSPDLTTIQDLEDAKAAYLSSLAVTEAVTERLSFLSVEAPFSGTITKRMVDEGAVVQSGMSKTNAIALYEIQDVSIIRITLPLPEADAAAVNVGMGATIQFPELPGEPYTAKVSRTAHAIDPVSGTMQVEIDIDNKNRNIKPGMYAKTTMQIASRDSVLSLPASAQYIFEDEFFLLIVAGGVVNRIPLRKGISNKDFFEILNAELTNQSQVIVEGKSLVKPGQKVDAIQKND